MSRARSSRQQAPAPLLVDTAALCAWLLARLGDDTRELPRIVCHQAWTLHESIVLALKNRRREHHVENADETLITLRAAVRMACEADYLTRDQLMYAMEQADKIGRQLGGWLRRLGPV